MRQSDRLLTPAVVVAMLVVGCVCVLATIAAVTWLTARGMDPDPMLRLVTQVATACGSLGTFLLTIGSRATVSKTERLAGQNAKHTEDLAGAVWDLADALPRPVVPPVPPPASRHAVPDETLIRAAPRKPPLPGVQADADWT